MRDSRHTAGPLLILILAAIVALGNDAAPTTQPATEDVSAYPSYVDLQSGERPSLHLNGTWQFATDPQEIGVPERWYDAHKSFDKQLTVPGAWQAQGIGRPDGYNKTQYLGTAWYKRKFDLPAGQDDRSPRRYWLKVGAVNPSADIWVNGQPVGYIRQPGQPARFDITAAILPGRPNDLTIRVAEINRGLGNWYNLNASWSGIWRKVEIETTAPLWIDDLFITPQPDDSLAHVRVKLQQHDGNHKTVTLQARVYDRNGQAVGRHEQVVKLDTETRHEFNILINKMRLWSPQQPYLYRLEVTLLDGDRTIDSVGDRFGMRKIETRGKQILLNNVPIYLRGVGDDGMYPNELCPETDPAELRERMRLIKACGFNYLYPCLVMQPEEYLDAADEVGLLVQYDAAALLAFQRNGLGALPICTPQERRQLILQQWLSILHWTQNHPSLVIYSPGSELLQEPLMAEMYHIARGIDPSRLVLSWSLEAQATDITDVGDLMAPLDPSETLHKTIAGWVTPVPGLIHEYIGAETLADPRIIAQFERGMEPRYENAVKTVAESLGITDLVPQLVDNSFKLANACRKMELEEARKVTDPCGYNVWLIQDIPICPQGIFNAFWEPKGIEPGEIARSAGQSVLLMQENRLQTRRCFTSGELITFEILASHFGPEPVRDGQLTWKLIAEPDGNIIAQGNRQGIEIDSFTAGKLCALTLTAPPLQRPTAARLTVALEGDNISIDNDWQIWLLPRRQWNDLDAGIGVLDSPAQPAMDNFVKTLPQATTYDGGSPDLLITDTWNDAVQTYAAGGGSVLLQLQEHDRLVKTQFMPRWPLSDVINVSATLIGEHPALGDFPHDGYCDYQFYHLIGRVITPSPQPGYVAGRAEAVNLSQFTNTPPPIIRVWHSAGHCAYLFEARVGRGKVMITTLQLAGAVGQYPEADYLLYNIIDYMSGNEFAPATELTAEELKTLCQ